MTKKPVKVSDLVKRLIEQVAFEARGSEFVDKKSGVSARLTISAYENAISAAERRAIINNEKTNTGMDRRSCRYYSIDYR